MTAPLIIGFDPSKCTGYALWDTSCDFSSIQTGCFEMPRGADEYFTADQLGLKVMNFLREVKAKHKRYPDFAVLEQQIQAQVRGDGGQNFAGSIYPWIASSAIVSTIANFGIPYGTLMPSSWRKAFFGQGFKPPLDNKGKKNWKKAAIVECERLGIRLPPTQALADDAAEACALAVCWAVKDMKFHAGRYHAPWMQLVQRRSDRVAA